MPHGRLSSVLLPGRSAACSAPQSSRQDDLSGNRKQEADSRWQLRKKELSHYLTTCTRARPWSSTLLNSQPYCPTLHSLLCSAGAAPHLLGFLGLFLDKSLEFPLPHPLLLRLLCLQGQGCPQYLCFSFTAESSVWLCRKELKEQAVQWERLARTAPSRRMQPHLAGLRGWCKCMEAGPGHRWRQRFPKTGRRAREPVGDQMHALLLSPRSTWPAAGAGQRAGRWPPAPCRGKQRLDGQEGGLCRVLRGVAWQRLPTGHHMVRLYSMPPLVEMPDHGRKLQSRLWAWR